MLLARSRATTILYSGICMFYTCCESKTQLGIGFQYLERARSRPITRAGEGSTAQQAELRPGDRIVAINGRGLDNPLRCGGTPPPR